jgi:hypothetical protein
MIEAECPLCGYVGKFGLTLKTSGKPLYWCPGCSFQGEDIPMNIVSSEEAEEADFVVCMRVGEGDETMFGDNQRGRCADCNHAIYYRPHNPKKPPKICMQCALARIDQPEGDDD